MSDKLLSPAFLDELRARVTLSAIVGRTVPLKKAGNEYKACCPFHQEKTPSFWVNDQKGFYHCFGCSAHGDAIRFLTETQGLGFMDAVKELADGAGLELPKPDPASIARAERATGLGDVMEQAARAYEKAFAGIEGSHARAYATQRGLSAETRATYRIGFAPDTRTGMRRALPDVPAAMLVEAGLLIDVDGKEPYDRFRGRLMVPIRDARGRTIAFGGRVIGDGEPKYLNSPETPLFDKGRTLFNLDRAGPASRKSGRLFVVEGYLDAIALDQAGVREAVAPLGTALTETQLELLWRCVDAPTLCFDGDKAGQKAALRAAERALPHLTPDRTLCFAILPDGADPDEIVQERGAEAFLALVAGAIPLDELLWRSEAGDRPLDTPEARARRARRFDDYADAIADRALAAEYRRAFRNRLFAASRGRQNVAPLTLRGDVEWPLHRALVAGLVHYPHVVSERYEQLASLRIKGRLGALLDVLVDGAMSVSSWDANATRDAIAAAGLGDVAEWACAFGVLPLSFTRSGGLTEAGRHDLSAFIDAIDAGQETAAA